MHFIKKIHNPHTPSVCLNSFVVTALQSINPRKIDSYSKHSENKLQMLTKTAVILITDLKFVSSCLP